MFKLEIKESDGKTYWVTHFSSQTHAEEWIKEEKTRPYWKAGLTTELTEIYKPTPEEIALREGLEAANKLALKEKEDAKAKAKAVDWKSLNLDPKLEGFLKDLLKSL